MKKLIMVLLALLLLPALAACSTSGERNPGGSSEVTYSYTPPMLSAGQGKDASNSTVTSMPAPTTLVLSGQGSVDTSTTDRMIVRNGSVSLLVEDIPISLDKISQMASNLKGYVVSSQSWRENERYYGSISIRVPVVEFDNVMRLLAAMAVEVKTQSSSSQDVTAEYTDLSAKLKTLEATEQQLLAIMKQATEIKDVLAVQNELTNIRTQIEQTKGRMQYLERTSATSLISINLEQSKLSVNISADRASVKMNETIYFTSQVFGGFTPYSYAWDFGDGSTGTVAQPSHKYGKAGTYTVSVKVSDDKGNSYTETRKDYITVLQSGWSIGGVVSGAWQGLVWLGEALVTLVIGLAIFSPVWIAIGVIIWLVRRKKKATAK
jgi:PKD repeat protein